MLKNRKIIIYIASVLLFLGMVGFSYSFFSSSVKGTGKENIVIAGALSLHFEDGSEMTIDDAYPGDKIEKTFSVTNTGTLPTSYTIWWKDLTNTFINDELVMSLECTSYKEEDGEKVVNGTCSGLNETVIGTDYSFPIKSNIQIESEVIHEYKLTILFKEMNTIQNYNMNKSFGGTINIKEYFHNETRVPVLESYDITNKNLIAKVSDTGYIVEYAITDASVTSADDVTWTTIERTSILDINQKIEDYDIKIWAKNNAGNIMCEDLTPQISLVVKPNGGTWNGSTGDQTYNFAYSQTLNIPNPSRDGYTFNNWTLVGSESKLSGTTFTAGIENTTLTANWTINEYTLTVNPNGGKYNNSTSNTTYTLDYKESQNISIPEREGYTFTGWSISSNKAQLSTNILTIGSENCTLTANWQANNYPWIAYHNKMNVSGSGYTLVDADTKSGEAEYGSKVTPSVNTYTGFTSPSSKEITIVVDTNPPVKNVVNYNYERNKYGLTINANGGTYSGNNPGELYYEEEITIANPNRTGYNFGGWTKSGGGTLTNTTFKGGSSTSTLTASWNPIESTVSFNVNGGSGSYSSITVEYDGTYGELPTPTRDGYEFLGWYTLATGGESITSDTKVSITSSQELFAQWKAKTFTVTFNINGGNTTHENETVEYDQPYGELPTASRNGYKFLGWYTEATGGTQVLSTNIVKITSNQTLYAQWEEYSYLATLMKSHNTPISDTSVKFGTLTTTSGDKGLYYTSVLNETDEDANGTSSTIYYYRGAVENNNVLFAGFCWKIIRTNEDGNIRMIYDGIEQNGKCYANGTGIGINDNAEYYFAGSGLGSLAKYNGYMYDGGNSGLKTAIDNWYISNISNKPTTVKNKIVNAIYCADRTTVSNSYGTFMGVMTRTVNLNNGTILSSAQPIFKCPNQSDQYTLSTNNGGVSGYGNNLLTYPIGALTGDELSFAGTVYAQNNTNYYLKNSSFYWTMSPGGRGTSGSYMSYSTNDVGMLGLGTVDDTNPVRPVISITSQSRVTTGTGTANNPYVIYVEY